MNTNIESAIVIIDENGNTKNLGNVKELNICYHADYLKEYCHKNYIKELKQLNIENGEYTLPVYIWFLTKYKNIIYQNLEKEGFIFLPNNITKKQLENLNKMSKQLENKKITIGYNIKLNKDGIIEIDSFELTETLASLMSKRTQKKQKSFK